MKFQDRFDRRQLLALGAVLFLTPALRLFPSGAAKLAGRAAWLTVPAALPLLLLYALFLCRFLERRQEGEGLAELTQRAVGDKAGKVILLFLTLWLLFYGAFLLRSCADRFITTIYPDSTPAVFAVTMGVIGTIAALGSARSLVRVAKLVIPLLFFVLALALLAALFSVKRENLLPVTGQDVLPILAGSLPTIDVTVVVLYLLCFLEGMTPKAPRRFRAQALWLLLMSALLCLIGVDVVGSFGAELTAKLTRPFFYLVRNLVFFRNLERVEALVVSLWVFPDFLMISTLLFAAQSCLRLALGCAAPYRGERLFDMGGGRWWIVLCGAAATVCSVFLAPDAQSLSFFSERLIPLTNLGVALVVLPIIYIVGRVRKSI